MTYPEASNFVGPNQLSIEAEVHPFGDDARLEGSGVDIVPTVDAVWSGGGCVGVVGAGHGDSAVLAVSP